MRFFASRTNLQDLLRLKCDFRVADAFAGRSFSPRINLSSTSIFVRIVPESLALRKFRAQIRPEQIGYSTLDTGNVIQDTQKMNCLNISSFI